MRLSAHPLLFLISVAACLSSSGCGSSGPIERSALCELAKDAFSRKMDFEPLYTEDSGACRALSVGELEAAGARELFADAGCGTAVSYAGEPWTAFCDNNLLGNERTRNYIGNPEAWSDLDPTVSHRVETRWNLSQGATLHLMTVNQTQDRKRPYLKRVEYRKADGCALGMHIYKSNPGATQLKPLLFFHGGGWRYRGLAAITGIDTSAPNLTDKGYVVFAPFYRLLLDSDGPEACHNADGREILDDIEAAFQWIFDHGQDFGMDPKWAQERKLSVMGQSAGGHLAAYLATYHPESVERGILLYPAPDLGFFAENIKAGGLYENRFLSSRKLLLGFFPQPGVTDPANLDPSAAEVRRNSFPDVIEPDPSRFPPLSVIHGSADTTVPVELSTRLCQALDPAESPRDTAYTGGDQALSCGEKSRLTVVKGANHMLDLRCFTGKKASIMDRLLPEAAALCPAGSASASRKVRAALEEAYSHF